MICCCTKTLNFCTQNVCGEIDFDILAIDSGTYTLITEFLGVQIVIKKTFSFGDKIIFPLSLLNENYEYTVNLFEPGGSQIVISKDLVEYDCFKFRTILSNVSSAVMADLPERGTIVIEDVIGENYTITGTTETVTGLTNGSTTITCESFTGVRVVVVRGNVPIPGINPGDGSNYYTKILTNNFITLNTPLALGEFIRIQTIPE